MHSPSLFAPAALEVSCLSHSDSPRESSTSSYLSLPCNPSLASTTFITVTITNLRLLETLLDGLQYHHSATSSIHQPHCDRTSPPCLHNIHQQEAQHNRFVQAAITKGQEVENIRLICHLSPLEDPSFPARLFSLYPPPIPRQFPQDWVFRWSDFFPFFLFARYTPPVPENNSVSCFTIIATTTAARPSHQLYPLETPLLQFYHRPFSVPISHCPPAKKKRKQCLPLWNPHAQLWLLRYVTALVHSPADSSPPSSLLSLLWEVSSTGAQQGFHSSEKNSWLRYGPLVTFPSRLPEGDASPLAQTSSLDSL